MLEDLFHLILITHSIAAFIVGFIYLDKGYKKDKDGNRYLNIIKFAWIMIAVATISLSLSALLFFAIHGFFASFLVGVLIVVPVLFIIFFIVTLSLGASYLASGYSTPKNLVKIKRGWIILIINWTVLLSLIVLLVMFMNGLIPIRLM